MRPKRLRTPSRHIIWSEVDLEDPFWLPNLEMYDDIDLGLSEADLVAGELYELWSIHSHNPVALPYVFIPKARSHPSSSGSVLERDYGDDVSLGGIISVENGTSCMYIQPMKKPVGKHNDMFGLLEVICSHGIVYTTADQLRPYSKRPSEP